MKKLQVIGCLLLMALQVGAAGPAGEGEFKLVKKDKAISLYERWISGETGENIREIKAVFLVRSDVAAAIQLLTDPVQGKEWNQHAKQYKVLLSGQRSQWITYTRYSIPWPFGDQDCCLSYKVGHDTGNPRVGVVSFEGVQHDQFPVSGSVTRIQGTKGQWNFEDAQGLMKVSYIISTSRSRKVPRWVADPIVRNNLVATMSRFRQLLEKRGAMGAGTALSGL